MTGPSSRPKPTGKPGAFVPHPDDEADVREAFASAERGEFMTAEESEQYLRELLAPDPSPKK